MKQLFKLSILLFTLSLLAACGDTASSSEASEDNVLRVGATGQSFPNTYQEGEELVGYDVEVFEAIADNLGYEVEWTLTSFDGLLGQLSTGKIDTIANAFEYTEERANSFLIL